MARIIRMPVKIRNDGMECGYCQSFKGTEEPEDACLLHRRAEKRKFEFTGSTCEDFVLYLFFYCRRNVQRLDIVVCVARQDRGTEGCYNCEQGERIFNYVKSEEAKFNENQSREIAVAAE